MSPTIIRKLRYFTEIENNFVGLLGKKGHDFETVECGLLVRVPKQVLEEHVGVEVFIQLHDFSLAALV